MAGIVLAGGKSTRMGTDKALLNLEGRTFLDTVIARIREVSEPIYVVTSPGRTYRLPKMVQVVHDIVADAGPLGGIVTGLMAAGPGHHLVVACDMPFVDPRVLRLLLQLVAGHDAAVPIRNGRPEPTCAAYSHSALPHLHTLLDAQEWALHRALRGLDVVQVPEERLRAVDPELRSLANINTPDDLSHSQLGTPERAGSASC